MALLPRESAVYYFVLKCLFSTNPYSYYLGFREYCKSDFSKKIMPNVIVPKYWEFTNTTTAASAPWGPGCSCLVRTASKHSLLWSCITTISGICSIVPRQRNAYASSARSAWRSSVMCSLRAWSGNAQADSQVPFNSSLNQGCCLRSRILASRDWTSTAARTSSISCLARVSSLSGSIS